MSQLNASPRDSQGIAGTEGIAGERLSCLRHVRLEVHIGELLASKVLALYLVCASVLNPGNSSGS